MGKFILAPVLIAASLTLTSAKAARQSFDPATPCAEMLLSGDAGDKTLVVFWASGYLAKTDGQPRVITSAHMDGMFAALQAVCKQAPTAPLVDIVDSFASAQVPQTAPTAAPEAPAATARPATSAVAPPVPAASGELSVIPAKIVKPDPSARQLLQRFFEPGVDRAALTATLKPTEADIRAVYAEPLASKLVTTYNAMFTPGVEIGPKAEHKELYTVITTTGKLKSRAAAIEAFPGGYKKVREYFIDNQPIVRFKFVRPGETIGLAFDGLIYVNGRWVLMPKPWRALK